MFEVVAESHTQATTFEREHPPPMPRQFTIAICTRGDNPASLLRAARSAVSQPGCCDEVIVVDQGFAPTSGLEELGDLHCGRRLVQVKDSGRGVSRARNIALRLARNDVVVFTDDDCEFSGDAAAVLGEALVDDCRCAMAYGTVYAEESVNALGFIPTYAPRRDASLRGRRSKLHDGGIGAAMACRKSSVLSLGGFDERFGPGSGQWLSCEEGELTFRVLKAGFTVAHRADARILHHGRRRWESAGSYNIATYRGVGAAYSMHACRGDLTAAILVVQQVGFAIAQIVGSLAKLKRPRGAKRAFGVLRGAIDGLRLRPLSGPAEHRT